MIGRGKRETSDALEGRAMGEYLGVVTQHTGLVAVVDPLLPASFDTRISDGMRAYPVGAFVYVPQGSSVARVVTGETLPRPDLWQAASARACANCDDALSQRLAQECGLAMAAQDRKAKVNLADVVKPAGVAGVVAADFGGGWIDELAVLAAAGRVYEIDRSSDLRASGTVRGSWCAKFIGHINGVPVYEDPTLDGNEIAPVVVDLGRPVPRDPDTTCSCGATKAHEERVCAWCFAKVERTGPAAIPGAEAVRQVRCPKCSTSDISARVEATMMVRPNGSGARDAYDVIDDGVPCFHGPPRLVAMACQSRACGHEWTPPEHLHHNWVRR